MNVSLYLKARNIISLTVILVGSNYMMTVMCKNNLPICVNNGHANGLWEYHYTTNISQKSFVCCESDKGEGYSLFPNLCGSRADWRARIDIHGVHHGSNRTLAGMGSGACSCDTRDSTRLSMNKIEKYRWTPSNCSLLTWNATQFCNLLGNRTILFIGDSTSAQTSATVMSLITNGGGNCANQLAYAQCHEVYKAAKNHGNLWDFLAAIKPDICIMNAGAHFHDLDSMRAVMHNLMIRMPQTRIDYPKTQFIWRTMNPGHVMCKNYTEPITEYLMDYADKDQYQWFMHKKFDAISKEYAKNMSMPVISMESLYLRPDAHADCLNYCLPGPLNLFADILLTMMHTGEV